jgi:zinc/manganese transport system substrate-binding protein
MNRVKLVLSLLGILAVAGGSRADEPATGHKLRVVTTLTTYADVARRVGGDRVVVSSLVAGDQDPHFVRPRPSLAESLAKANLFVSTGLDLELWVPGLVDLSQNPEIRSGQRRYVSASAGVTLLEKPTIISQSEGHVHIYGNPHFQLSPIAMEQVARNIAAGLTNIDPAHAQFYADNAKRYGDELTEKLVGPELIRLLGGPTVLRLLANPDRFISFLKSKTYKSQPLISKLGGWLGKAMPLRGQKLVAYHKNWVYFAQLFGLDFVNFVEPKPGVPPRADHVAEVVDQMRSEHIKVIVAANFYDEGHVRDIAKRVGAKAVIVSLYPGGAPGVSNFEQVIDRLLDQLLAALGPAPAGTD